MNPISFPDLGLTVQIERVAFQIFGKNVYWYGVIIACGFLLAALLCSRQAKRFGVRQEQFLDMLLFALPIGIICARIYYVVFNQKLYVSEGGAFLWKNAVAIWDGGIAIYGGIIGGALTCLIFCLVRKVPFLAMADLTVLGLLIGQCIGRWGNFINQEAYGGPCSLPWRMGLMVDGQYITVHPTFLYESLWNLVGFCLLFFLVRRLRTFDGELFLSYLIWYGVGRFWIEGLRTDSLYLFQTGIRVSQMVAAVSAVTGALLLIWNLAIRRRDPRQMWVNRSAEIGIKEEQRRKKDDGDDH